ncbi:MAG: amidophosphoribosyltransferase [Elusimicrobia bacterium]|nr:amidophosphoribosyltransferase [Candidatus Obscuribacterium magneticum]
MSGIFGVVSNKDCIETLFYGTDYHSHLGTQFAGLAVWSDRLSNKIHDISRTQFKSKFFDELAALKGTKGIGVISDSYPQPLIIHSKFGQFSICTNGFIDNAKELMGEMLAEGETFSDSCNGQINMTELVAKLISKGTTLIEGIEHMFLKIRGSCSLLILTQEGIWAARDKWGNTPLVVGEKDGDWAVTTETTAFPNLGFAVKKFIGPGEIIFLDTSGMQVKTNAHPCNQICAFLWIYTGFPASIYEGVNVEVVRERSGRLLAKNDDVEADITAGIPDSGTTHAIGYAMESEVPFRRPLVKYTPGFDRSYTPPLQSLRDLIARMKLVPIKDIIEGQRIVFCDDSIVRGTQFKNYTIRKLKENGAKEIHLRIACPPLMFPCMFNYSTRTRAELAARRAIKDLEKQDLQDVTPYLNEESLEYKRMVDWITRDLDVTSLKYQKLSDMVDAIGLPKESLCLYCWTGEWPTKKEETSPQKVAEPALV